MLAILITSGGFYVISRPGISRPRLVLSGVFMGLGILAMHYTGMAAMRGPVELNYDRLWVALSVIIAIGARPDERRGGKERGGTWRSRWAPAQKKTKKDKIE